MTDVLREKYSKLMTQIEELEDVIAEMQEKSGGSNEQVMVLKQELAEKKNELARISDGCGTGHSM